MHKALTERADTLAALKKASEKTSTLQGKTFFFRGARLLSMVGVRAREKAENRTFLKGAFSSLNEIFRIKSHFTRNPELLQQVLRHYNSAPSFPLSVPYSLHSHDSLLGSKSHLYVFGSGSHQAPCGDVEEVNSRPLGSGKSEVIVSSFHKTPIKPLSTPTSSSQMVSGTDKYYFVGYQRSRGEASNSAVVSASGVKGFLQPDVCSPQTERRLAADLPT